MVCFWSGRLSQYLSTWKRNPDCPLEKEKPVCRGPNNFGKIGVRGVRPHWNDSSGYELSHRHPNLNHRLELSEGQTDHGVSVNSRDLKANVRDLLIKHSWRSLIDPVHLPNPPRRLSSPL